MDIPSPTYKNHVGGWDPSFYSPDGPRVPVVGGVRNPDKPLNRAEDRRPGTIRNDVEPPVRPSREISLGL